MFAIERELTDGEIDSLERTAQSLLSFMNGYDAAAIYNVIVGERKASSILEDIVKADGAEATVLFPEITQGWPDFVRGFLGTKGWQLGCGYVGETFANVGRHG